MIDREYIEKHLSAYLDGELPAEELDGFETELRKYPDLVEQVEQFRKLEKVAKETEIEMPAEGYFENLAERIDAGIARRQPQRAGFFIHRIISSNWRLLKAVSSVAAVVLVAVVAREMYHPAVEQFERPVAPSSKLQMPAMSTDAIKQEYTDTLVSPRQPADHVTSAVEPEPKQDEDDRLPEKSKDKLELRDPAATADGVAPFESQVPEPVPEPAPVKETITVESQEDKLVEQAEMEEPVPDGAIEAQFEIPSKEALRGRDKTATGQKLIEPKAREFLSSRSNKRVQLSESLSDADGVLAENGAAELSEEQLDSLVNEIKREVEVFEFPGIEPFTEAFYDSVLAASDSRQDVTQAARVSVVRALEFERWSNIEDAQGRIETILSSGETPDRELWFNLYRELSRIRPTLPPRD